MLGRAVARSPCQGGALVSREKKPSWGGARQGAGRRSIDPTGKPVRVTVTLTQSLFEALNTYAAKQRTNVAGAVRSIIEGALS